jgi:peptidoglycan/LPS O-acetylase OafA/YrhL
MPAPANSNATKWADVSFKSLLPPNKLLIFMSLKGLRGIASLLVVTAHVCRSLAPFLLSPTMGEKSPPVIMQLPFLRCFVMGRASVAVFAILSGYVNALKPTRQTRAGQIDATLAGIAKSAYRRTGRFIAPVVVATCISWLMCQFGAYNLAKVVSSQWIRDTSPRTSKSFAHAFFDLFYYLGNTWTSGGNIYDPIQWTMTYLLRGSMLVYLALFATVYIQPKFRVVIFATMVGYYWWIGDGMCNYIQNSHDSD